MKHTRSLTCGALCIALIAVCSWISLPTAVPFTLQTFAVFFTSAILGPRRGALAVAAYILLGMAGAPVFAGFASGLRPVIGPTGGFLVGFIPAAFLSGLLMKNGGLIRRTLAMLAGLCVCYAAGMAWYLHMYADNLWAALTVCVAPFVLPDVLKIVLAAYVSLRLDRFRLR